MPSRNSAQPPLACSEHQGEGDTVYPEEEVVRLHGKLSDHLLEQQNAMVAIIKQGRDTKEMIKCMMAESQQQYILCREQIKAMHLVLLKLESSGPSVAPVQPALVITDEGSAEGSNVAALSSDSPRSSSKARRRKKPKAVPVKTFYDDSSSEEIDSDKEIQASDHRFFKGSSRLLRSYDARGRPVASEDDEVIPTVEEMDLFYDDEPDKEEPARDVFFTVCGLELTLTGLAEGFSLFLVIVNSFFSGMQANASLRQLHNAIPVPSWVEPVDMSFTILFTLDFLLRFALWGRVFMLGSDKMWNVVDLVCVVSALVDSLVSFADLSFMRLIRIFRIARVLRVFRGLRAIRDLRLLMAAIMASLASFGWGVVLLTFTMYMSAIVIIQSLVVFAENFGAEVTPDIFDSYGTVFRSMTSLFKAISGGKDWDDLLQPLAEQSHFYTYFYLFYIMTMVLGIMNILTAVFCEQAAEIAKVDQGLVIEDEINKTKNDRDRLMKFFAYADKDGNGMISEVELEAFLKSQQRRAMLNLLDLDVAEARGLFDLMDSDHLGYVPLEAYIDTIIRLRGNSKGHDIANLLFEHRRLLLRLTVFMCYTNDNFSILFKELNAKKDALSLDKYVTKDFLAEQEKATKVQVRRQLCSHLGALNEDHDDAAMSTITKKAHAPGPTSTWNTESTAKSSEESK